MNKINTYVVVACAAVIIIYFVVGVVAIDYCLKSDERERVCVKYFNLLSQ